MSTSPGDGERRAAVGYEPQYRMGAKMILEALTQGDLEWIRVADPDAGRVDDIQIGITGRVDAYQVKWTQYVDAITFNDLTNGNEQEPSLIEQLADGWKKVRNTHPHRRVVVHLLTNKYPSSSSSAKMPPANSKPIPYHLAAFIEQAWKPSHSKGKIESGIWSTVWNSLREASKLPDDEFSEFVQDCSLDFQGILPDENDSDANEIAKFLFRTVASAIKIVEVSRSELLIKLGWQNRYDYRNVHEFPDPQYLYRPIQSSVGLIESALQSLPGGYIGVFGSPGSGKSTLLTQTLRSLPIRLVKYYAYVPDTQDLSILRGESVNFLQDITLRLQKLGICKTTRPDSSDRAGLLSLFKRQLQELGDGYQESGTKTVILIDGLDHIAREQNPERSLLKDLPLPNDIPNGVYLVMGSQTNGLNELLPRVRESLQSEERRIEIKCLSIADVYSIADKAIEGLENSEHKQIFEISDGHPLALIYLLKQLCQVDSNEERTRLLEEVVPYTGSIDDQYITHWRSIENDENLIESIGLIARIRGAIPLDLINQWTDKTTRRKLQNLLLTFFEKEGEKHYVFFHNSFRLFLQEKTAAPLLGETQEKQDREYHQKLADLFQDSSAPYKWETLYHLYKACNYNAVVKIATQKWFRNQAETFRPYKSIWTDIQLAFKAAGECQDVIALMQLTFAGVAIDQRINKIDSLPELLLKVGKSREVIEHLRDGNQLRSDPLQSLNLSIQLHRAGLKSEGFRLFELAEPLELLSGKSIATDNYHLNNIYEILHAWIKGALVFRGSNEVLRTIKKIRIEPDQTNNENINSEESNTKLQNWLLFQCILECCKCNDRDGWEAFCNELEQAEERIKFFVLFRSTEIAYKKDEHENANALLDELLSNYHPRELADFIEADELAEIHLSITEVILRIKNDKVLARLWLQDIAPIPLQDKNRSVDNKESLFYKLQFRYARLQYILGSNLEPESIRNEAENCTIFNHYVKEDEKISYRRHALAIFYLARLDAWGFSGLYLQPTSFIRDVNWIIDFVGSRYLDWVKPLDLGAQWSREWILSRLVRTAFLHGDAVVNLLAENFKTRWTSLEEQSSWPVGIQRLVIIELSRAKVNSTWVRAQLNRIKPIMLNNLDTDERVIACREQAEAWLMLGENDIAISELEFMMLTARGISYDKDEQLSTWVDWLGRVNQLEPEKAKDRFLLMLKRLLSVKESASGVGNASGKLIEVVFQQSPTQAVYLLKGFLEMKVVGHENGIVCLLQQSLESNHPPIIEVLHTIVDLILPFSKIRHPSLIESFISKTLTNFNSIDAHDAISYLVDRIRVHVLSQDRPDWYRSIAKTLQSLGYSLEKFGLEPEELLQRPDSCSSSNQTDSDKKLILRNGEKLGLDEILTKIQSVNDFQKIMDESDREINEFFYWQPIVDHLINRLSSITELIDLQKIIENKLDNNNFQKHEISKILLVLSKSLLNFGRKDSAWMVAEKALAATESHTWNLYYNGGTRYEILKCLILIDSNKGRKKAIELFAYDGSRGSLSSSTILLSIDDLFEVLIDKVPVVDMWNLIEEYLDELFSGILIKSEVPSEMLVTSEFCNVENDSPALAIATLQSLHLDHPSYIVAQKAVQSCTASLLQGSTAIITALKEAFNRTDQSIERALMSLDAACIKKPEAASHFDDELNQLQLSSNFFIRLISNRIVSQVKGEEIILKPIEKAISSMYSFELPSLSSHHTNFSQEDDTVTLIGDLAFKIRPFDIEARKIAQIVKLSEDNIIYQAIQFCNQLENQHVWSTGSSPLAPQGIQDFLVGISLYCNCWKPHIAISRRSLAYVCAELYDGGYLQASQVSQILIYFDRFFTLYRPVSRPLYISLLQEVPNFNNDQTGETWINSVNSSLKLLNIQTSDEKIILCEWTNLKHFYNMDLEEERISVIRAVEDEYLWTGLNIEQGFRAFPGFMNCRAEMYLHINTTLEHLIVSACNHGFDTPGEAWIAFNPSLAKELGWSSIESVKDSCFRWVNQSGDLVVESLWWNDGLPEQHLRHPSSEIGSGWLVLATQQGFAEIKKWAGDRLSRGGIIRRSLGLNGDNGKEIAFDILPLP
jgi:hypothetical protein